ncbi:hypothetical protein Syun_027077 [Stephania yunnanensis]|uniref:Uncharacterized protein n=1 Tax=Stephania yunnanensis TaxID=152371 RepID=A0AAP0EF01_9MAGN
METLGQNHKCLQHSHSTLSIAQSRRSLSRTPHSLTRSLTLASLTLAQQPLRENPSFVSQTRFNSRSNGGSRFSSCCYAKSLFDAFAAHVRSNEPPIVRRPAMLGGGLGQEDAKSTSFGDFPRIETHQR